MSQTPRPLPLLLVLLLAILTASCDNGSNSTQPSATRVLRIDGDLNFGDVPVAQDAQKTLRLFNDGSGNLTVSAIQGPAVFTASWSNGVIAPGTSQTIVVSFRPAAAQSYDGTLVVVSDATGGANQIRVAARGIS
jgi:hypothetical protein